MERVKITVRLSTEEMEMVRVLALERKISIPHCICEAVRFYCLENDPQRLDEIQDKIETLATEFEFLGK